MCFEILVFHWFLRGIEKFNSPTGSELLLRWIWNCFPCFPLPPSLQLPIFPNVHYMWIRRCFVIYAALYTEVLLGRSLFHAPVSIDFHTLHTNACNRICSVCLLSSVSRKQAPHMTWKYRYNSRLALHCCYTQTPPENCPLHRLRAEWILY